MSQHLLRSLDPLLGEIVVRRKAGRLLKSSCEMMYRQSRDGRQRCQIHAFAQMGLDIFPDPRMAPGDNPPCACGAGAIFPSESITSRRGRVCRATFVALRQAVWTGGVTSADRLSLLPAITNRVADVGSVPASKQLEVSVRISSTG